MSKHTSQKIAKNTQIGFIHYLIQKIPCKFFRYAKLNKTATATRLTANISGLTREITMSHPSDSHSDLPIKQSVEHILNWFPEDYDFRVFQNYMYGSSQGQTFYYWMYSDEPNIIEIGRGGVINQFLKQGLYAEKTMRAIDLFES